MIAVIWQSYNTERSPLLFGDQYLLYTIFTRQLVANYIEDFIQYPSFKQYNESGQRVSGAIVSVPLCFNENYISQLNDDLKQFNWCLVILTANEYGSKYYQKIKHPNMKLWLQSPAPDDVADRFLGLGYPTFIPAQEIKYPKKRKYDWFFAGQVNHQRRVECVNELKRLTNGKLLATAGFNQGYDYNEYINYMANAKLVPCPGGPETPDSFRVYEALEVGCIPIVDKHYGRSYYDGNYWEKLFGAVPFPVIDDWTNLPRIMGEQLDAWDNRSHHVSDWWQTTKAEIVKNLYADVHELRGVA